MRYLANANIAKLIDKLSINEFGIPSMVLMERASYEMAEAISRDVTVEKRLIAVCGRGNNGGDAIATARILHERGYDVSLYLTRSPESLSEQTSAQYHIAVKCGVKTVCNPDFCDYEVIIDGIYGVGLNKDIADDDFVLIETINNSKAAVYAVDIPSGINATTGKVMGIAVKAFATVTFGLEKTGIVLYPGNIYAGSITVADIGFPGMAVNMAQPYEFCYEEGDIKVMPKRNKLSNKGTYGKVLVAAGSYGMCGASYLSAKSAYRMGCGMVKILTPEANRIILQEKIPEAILAIYDDDITEKYVKEQLEWADSIVIGPGLGQSETAHFLVKTVLENANVPVVVDADAINIIAGDDMCCDIEKIGNLIFTPHLKEMSRLCKCSIDDIRDDLIGFAKGKASPDIVFALKDARTVVSDGKKSYINVSGNDGMATAGSGDVLTGIIAALLAQGMNRFDAASLGVYVHGMAGDEAAARFGHASMMASDIIDAISYILSDE